MIEEIHHITKLKKILDYNNIKYRLVRIDDPNLLLIDKFLTVFYCLERQHFDIYTERLSTTLTPTNFQDAFKDIEVILNLKWIDKMNEIREIFK